MERMDDNGHGTTTTYPIERQSPMVLRFDEWPEKRAGESLEKRLDRISKWFR